MLKTILIAALLAASGAGAAPGTAASAATATGIAATTATGAEGPVIPPGARLAGTCAACHGSNGATIGGSTGATLPPLAGQPKEALAAALRDFKSGKRQATIMTQIAKGYTDQQIEQLATWFAAQKP